MDRRIIIAAGLLLSCFLPLIFPSTGFSYGIIYFAYYSFLASSLIGYFANYRQTLLGADQRNYVVAFYFQTASIIKILCQILSAWYTGSYYLWIMIELLFGIIYSFILNWKINQVYPWLKSNVALGKELFRKYPEVIKYTRQLFVHRLGYFSSSRSRRFWFMHLFPCRWWPTMATIPPSWINCSSWSTTCWGARKPAWEI